MTIAQEIKDTYTEYKVLETLSDTALELCDEHPEDEELEAASDKAYEVMWEVRARLVELIRKATGCDMKTANAILASDKFASLMNRRIV